MTEIILDFSNVAGTGTFSFEGDDGTFYNVVRGGSSTDTGGPSTPISSDLVDVAGNATGISLFQVSVTNNETAGSSGVAAPYTGDAAWLDVNTATVGLGERYWVTGNNGVRVFGFGNLNSSKTYRIEGFSSRDTAGSRLSDWTIGATTVQLEAIGNDSNTAIFTGISPDENGEIRISIEEAGGDNTFAYLNAVRLVEETASGPSLETIPTAAYPGQSRTVTGTGFGATQGTGGITIGGVAQTITSWSDTSITFTTVLGANSYGAGKTIELTTDAGGTDSGTIELVSDTANGFGFVTMSSPNTTDESNVTYDTTPTVVTGDQFEWEDFNALGNLVIDAAGFVSSVDTAGVFRGRFWDASDGTWGAVGEFTVQIEDVTSPSITSVDVPAAGSYKAGDVLTFTSNFSESVDVTGVPAINFSVDGSPRQANYSSGTGSSALVFTYTIQAGDDASGLSVTSLSLDGGTIVDAATNAADLTLVSVGDTSGIIIDTVAPTVGVDNVTTTNTAPTISGTASGVSQVSVVVNAVTYTPTVSGGTWSQQLPTLAVNDYPVTVDATDDAGNTAVQAQATLSIVEAGSGFIVAKDNASGNSLWGSIGMPEGALVSLVDDDSGAVTLNSEGNMECSKNASVATLDVDGSPVKVLVRPVGTPVKPFYKVNWQILD